jgi:cysteine-rich repeat protein
LYVSGTDGVVAYPLDAEGVAGSGTPLPGDLDGSDGMIVDCADNLYVTLGQDVAILAPSYEELGRISVNANGVSLVTSVALGGDPVHRLYLTTLGSQPRLFYIELPRCGDGQTTPGEDCDDGNAESGDGCSAECTSE